MIKEVNERCPDEVWAEVLTLPGFHASDQGRIRNPRGRILRQRRDRGNNAPRVRIHGRSRTVAFLILSAFTGFPLKGFYVQYRNRDRSDNRLENLLWAGKGSG